MAQEKKNTKNLSKLQYLCMKIEAENTESFTDVRIIYLQV